jgi:hypothetical protein
MVSAQIGRELFMDFAGARVGPSWRLYQHDG